MFGDLVRLKCWDPRPRPCQCTNCWRFGHLNTNCHSPPNCNRCGGQHSMTDHCNHCTTCVSEKCHIDIPCNHPPFCINCRGCHVVDHPACSEKCKLGSFMDIRT